MFAGRIHELNTIDDSLSRLKEGNPTHLMIVGERGIGKSSLLLFTNMLASGKINWQQETPYEFIPIQFSIDRALEQIGFVKKVKNGLERYFQREEKILSLFQKSWEFLKKLEIAGSKINIMDKADAQINDEFAYSLADTCKSIVEDNILAATGIKVKKEGIILLIDETDNASIGMDLGTLLKNLSETLQVEGCNNVLFILSGLPRIREVLKESHPSSLRLFEELELLPLYEKDIKDVYERGLAIVNQKAPIKYKYDPEALQWMITLSEGYPHFIQQIGFSTFDLNADQVITTETANRAIFGANGAIDLIGDRYYRDMYYEKIKEDSYRDILNIMADAPNAIVTRKYIKELFKGAEQSMDNGLRVLKDRNIILPILGKVGQYRFQWMGFSSWIKLFSQRERM
jgi:hypothetical protein